MNSLMLRQTGKVKEEVVILAEDEKNSTAVRVLDLKQLVDDFNYEKKVQLEMQTCSIKFGQLAREALKIALNEGRVPSIEFDERTYQFGDGASKVNIHGLSLGRRGLLNLIQDQREILI